MPLYEYQCEACRHRFENIQKFSDPLVETCPRCGGTVQKLQSSPAFKFKGSGFYVTDYPKKNLAAATTDSDANASPREKTETQQEKPEKQEKTDKDQKTEKGAPQTDSAPPSVPAAPAAPAAAKDS
jgi:putative FmdB family regulatory protein